MLMSVCGAVLSTLAMAQDWDPAFGRERLPEAWADRLLDAYDLVAVGRFEDIPDFSGNVEDLVSRQDVTVVFAIRRIYKGPASNGSRIAVQVQNEMLAYPGESVSRYAWRLNYQLELGRAVAETMNQLADLERRLEEGAIDTLEYDAERERLERLGEEQLAAEIRAPTEVHLTLHSESFYDLDGAIAPNAAEYLVGLDAIPGETESYRLSEYPLGKPSGIYWGVMAEDVTGALDSRVGD